MSFAARFGLPNWRVDTVLVIAYCSCKRTSCEYTSITIVTGDASVP